AGRHPCAGSWHPGRDEVTGRRKAAVPEQLKSPVALCLSSGISIHAPRYGSRGSVAGLATGWIREPFHPPRLHPALPVLGLVSAVRGRAALRQSRWSEGRAQRHAWLRRSITRRSDRSAERRPWLLRSIRRMARRFLISRSGELT